MAYPEAVDAIVDGMAPLGDAYQTQTRAGLTTERWVDWASNAGKRQGAYSNGGARVKPYIFMSFQGGLGSMSTLAHEIGHSMHSWLSQQRSGQQRAALHPVRRRGGQQLQSGDGAPSSVRPHHRSRVSRSR